MESGAEVWAQLHAQPYADLRRHLDACYRRQRIRHTAVRVTRGVARALFRGLVYAGCARTSAAHLRR